MIIQLFEISKEFIVAMYSPFVDDITENDNDEKRIEDDDEPVCGCNLCHTTRQLLLFIHPNVSKKLNDNKVD